MLTEEEKKFIDYWEKNRDRQKKTVRQFLLGIPAGLLFVIPILLTFFSGWYKRPGVLLVALLLIIGFIAIFSRRLRWEKNEQFYKELKSRESANLTDQEKN